MNKDIVARCSIRAFAEGIYPGMSLAHARACSENLHIYEHEPSKTLTPLKSLCQELHRFTPLVALDPVLYQAFKNNSLGSLEEEYVGIILDLRGTERLYQSTLNIANKVYQFFLEKKIKVKIGTSKSLGMAWALAHFSNSTITPQEDSLKQTAAKLPIQALRVEQKILDSLNYYGIKTIGELAAMRRKELAKRFGLFFIERLQQLLGESEEILEYALPKKQIHISKKLAHPLKELKALSKAVSKLTYQLHHSLTRKNTMPQYYESLCLCENKTIIKKKFSLYRIDYDLNELEQLLYQLLERLKLNSKVTAIYIEAKHVRSLTKKQRDLSSTEESTEIDYKEFLQRATSIIKNNQIFFITQKQDHSLESAYRFTQSAEHSLEVKSSYTQAVYKQCPTTVLYPPQEVKAIALLPEHAPVRLFWKKFEYTIKQGFGPEKISENWWQTTEQNTSREYFKVLTHTGLWLWVFRSMPEHRWYLHGFWS